MVFSMTNRCNVKHMIYIEPESSQLVVHIVRQAPMISSIKLNFEKGMSYLEAMSKIQRVVELDHEMFEAMKRHLSDEATL